MGGLMQERCVPCEGGVEPLQGEKAAALLEQLKGWEIVEDSHLYKKYSFKDFKESLAFVNKVGVIAEQEGHHPDISFTWGKVEITLSTHAINGLSENDFILAMKIDQVQR